MSQPEFHFDLNQEFLTFFVYFSRFEYILKDSKYLRSGNRDGAEVDWVKLGEDMTKRGLLEAIQNDPISAMLFTDPPKKEIAINYTDERLVLGWRDVPKELSMAWLIDAVKRVRNNLFHGGKHLQDNNQRDLDLVRAAERAIFLILDILDLENEARGFYG